ncbi:carboxypeptidase-like regulatory domain-containing protein [Pseudoxanthomonas indica]|uniref:Carboxypeptidase regulatory-like domain-containing protein n=1 Tax=Pseudoxanthomonas indica TaxID=428993 RepID=A0A1T5J710_9GAMM|nr:carboxypeptidase-like regulatory domain-containing protein [Pseudoxanthomonas indica]GGD56807.1 hypothetical protein GCM10007235_31460 [Pseudoxanthomonas indica]SKC47195.1 Carboxypeptidase regulatory-like domain-containing protein [Pseudoxanthomonas indica]
MALVSKSRWLFLALSLLMMLVSFSALAQRADGNIGGNAVAGDQVAVHNTGTGFKRETVVEEGGKYHFRNLPLGEYRVSVTRNGESVGNFVVNVRPGATARVPLVPADEGVAAEPAAAPPAN